MSKRKGGKQNNSAQAKRVKVGFGADCPKCDRPMVRFKHPDSFVPKPKQPFHFAWWDVCRPCRHIQHYEEAKVFAGQGKPQGRTDPSRTPGEQMTEEFRAIIGPRPYEGYDAVRGKPPHLMPFHRSDCAIFNEPAMRDGPCDCGFEKMEESSND